MTSPPLALLSVPAMLPPPCNVPSERTTTSPATAPSFTTTPLLETVSGAAGVRPLGWGELGR